jgi:hypothetical protein
VTDKALVEEGVYMAKIGERRVRAAIRKADGHKKGLLLANHYAEHCMLGKPLLTAGEINDIVKEMRSNPIRDTERDLPDDEERRELASMMRAEDNLFLCITDAKVAYLEVLLELTLLQSFLALVTQRRHAKGHLWEVCYRCNVERNATLFEHGVSVDQLVPPTSTSLEEESDGTTQTDVEVPDEDVVAISEIIERLKPKLSILKALTEAMRDVMDQRQIPIPVFSETIDWYDQHIGEFISGIKRIFYGALFPEWEEQKASLIEHADPHVVMMETLPEYEDVPFDEDVYDYAWPILSGRTL